MGKGVKLCDRCKFKGKVNDSTARCTKHQPGILVTPDPHDFPLTRVGDTSSQDFRITNNGQGGHLRLGTITLAGADAAHFHIQMDNASGQTLTRNQWVDITIEFRPTSIGQKSARIHVPSNLPLEQVNLTGTTPRVVVVVSCDWDGHDLRDDNIDDFEAFRNRYPGIPITHFICASYFTGAAPTTFASNPQNLQAIKDQMERAFLDDDEIGLHVHGWKTVIDRAQADDGDLVQWFTDRHDWATLDASPDYKNCWSDIGHTNPLTEYTAAQVEQILTTSKNILDANLPGGHQVSGSFRSGGWVTNDDIKLAILRAGFTIDSSAVPENFAAPGSSLNTLHAGPPHMWPGIDDESEPYEINLVGGGTLKEVPNNFGLADYRAKADMNTRMQAYALGQPGPTLVHIGFHQETVKSLGLYHQCSLNNPCAVIGCTHEIIHANQCYLDKLTNTNGDGLLDIWHADPTIWDNLEFLTVEDAANLFLP